MTVNRPHTEILTVTGIRKSAYAGTSLVKQDYPLYQPSEPPAVLICEACLRWCRAPLMFRFGIELSTYE